MPPLALRVVVKATLAVAVPSPVGVIPRVGALIVMVTAAGLDVPLLLVAV